MHDPDRLKKSLNDLPIQNSAVGNCLGHILENAYGDHSDADRDDWQQIKLTIETFLFTDLTLDPLVEGNSPPGEQSTLAD